MPRTRTAIAPASVLLVLLRTGAGAQTPERDSTPGVPAQSGCMRALSASAYTRVPVFLYGEVADTLDRGARPMVDLAAQAVARFVRIALWGSVERAAREDSAGRLAAADSLFARRALRGGVRVVARRGGRMSWRPTTPPGTVAADSAAALLLARAFGAARDSGEVFVPDDVVRGDSLVFELGYVHQPVTGPTHALGRVQVRNPAPVFTLPVVWITEATVVPGTIRPNYPTGMQMRGFEGRVVLEFVIDPAGRPEPATVRDMHPEVVATLAPALRDAYRQFLQVSREAILRARFVPALAGGCPVRQLVQQTISYTINR